mgnify:FL=1
MKSKKQTKQYIADALIRNGTILKWCGAYTIVEAYGHRYRIEYRLSKVKAIVQLEGEKDGDLCI